MGRRKHHPRMTTAAGLLGLALLLPLALQLTACAGLLPVELPDLPDGQALPGAPSPTFTPFQPVPATPTPTTPPVTPNHGAGPPRPATRTGCCCGSTRICRLRC